MKPDIHLDETSAAAVRRLTRQVKYRDAELRKVRAEVKQLRGLLNLEQLAQLVETLRTVVQEAPVDSVTWMKRAEKAEGEVKAWDKKWEETWKKLHDAARRHGLCSVYDDEVQRIGGIPRPGRY